jgi:hypothetical protein
MVNNVIEMHKPPISKKKQEEMRKIIDEVNKSPQDKIKHIKYERSNDSVINKFGNRSMHGRTSVIKAQKDGEGKYLSHLSSNSKMEDSIGSPNGKEISFHEGDNDSQAKDLEGLGRVPEKVAKFDSALTPNDKYFSK